MLRPKPSKRKKKALGRSIRKRASAQKTVDFHINGLFTLCLHCKDTQTCALRVNASKFPTVEQGAFFALTEPERSTNDRQQSEPLYLEVGQICTDVRGTWDITVCREIGQLYGFRNFMAIHVRRVEEGEAILSLVELSFQNQYISRGETWRIERELVNTGLYFSNNLEVSGFKVKVQLLKIRGKNVLSGIVGPRTKFVFRSGSVLFHFLFQLSAEMWTYTENGTLYFEESLDGFCQTLFERWNECHHSHIFSVIFFTRMVEKDIGSNINGSKPYEDYYKVVIDRLVSRNWCAIQATLRKAFFEFQTQINAAHLGRYTPAFAKEGNILEVINLCCNIHDQSCIDQDLDRTGMALAILTPGTGVFFVDEQLADFTRSRVLTNGIGADLVSVNKPPLVPVPLFVYGNSLPKRDDVTRLTDWSKSSFNRPAHWLQIKFFHSGTKPLRTPLALYASNRMSFYCIPLLREAGIVGFVENHETADDIDHQVSHGELPASPTASIQPLSSIENNECSLLIPSQTPIGKNLIFKHQFFSSTNSQQDFDDFDRCVFDKVESTVTFGKTDSKPSFELPPSFLPLNIGEQHVTVEKESFFDSKSAIKHCARQTRIGDHSVLTFDKMKTTDHGYTGREVQGHVLKHADIFCKGCASSVERDLTPKKSEAKQRFFQSELHKPHHINPLRPSAINEKMHSSEDAHFWKNLYPTWTPKEQAEESLDFSSILSRTDSGQRNLRLWKSVVCPATLPLTTDMNRLEKLAKGEYIKSAPLTFCFGKDVKLASSRALLDEFVMQRLAGDFQIMELDDKRVSGSIDMCQENSIHQIIHDEDGQNIVITKWTKKWRWEQELRNTRVKNDDKDSNACDQIMKSYSYNVWNPFSASYVKVKESFIKTHERSGEFWNNVDHFCARSVDDGELEMDGLRAQRIKFALTPAAVGLEVASQCFRNWIACITHHPVTGRWRTAKDLGIKVGDHPLCTTRRTSISLPRQWPDRDCWVDLFYDTVYDPAKFYYVEVRWLVSSAFQVKGLICKMRNGCRSLGELYSVPVSQSTLKRDPFHVHATIQLKNMKIFEQVVGDLVQIFGFIEDTSHDRLWKQYQHSTCCCAVRIDSSKIFTWVTNSLSKPPKIHFEASYKLYFEFSAHITKLESKDIIL